MDKKKQNYYLRQIKNKVNLKQKIQPNVINISRKLEDKNKLFDFFKQ